MNSSVVFDISYTDNGIKVTSNLVRSFYIHAHVYHEMLAYDAFGGYITVNGQEIAIDSPTLVLVTASDFHSTSVNSLGDAKYIKIAFSEDIVSQYVSPHLSQPLILRNYTNNQYICELLKRIADPNNGVAKNRILLDAILLELIELGESIGYSVKKDTELHVLNAVHMINAHFIEPINLQTVAEELNITPQYLSSIFSKQLGVSFSEYLRDKRLNYASYLLQTGKYNVTEVCYQCGYRNLSHFLRSFRKKYGVSPKSYANNR